MSKITIAGRLGSGKSTIAKRLTDRLNLPYHSTGSLQRAMAEQANLSTLELNKQSETNAEIDHTIDGSTKRLDEIQSAFILDSRMAWHFVRRSFKLYLYVDANISAERIFHDRERTSEAYQSMDEALRYIQEREQSEIRRFQQLYGVDITDFANYDAVIDTSYAAVDDLVDLILALFKQWSENGSVTNPIWLSPKLLYPTQEFQPQFISENEINHGTTIAELIDYPNPVSVIRYHHSFFIYEHHQQAAHFIKNQFSFVPCVLPFLHSNQLSDMDRHRFIEEQCTQLVLSSWENGLNIRYHSMPQHLSS